MLNGLTPCPPWCASKRPADDPLHFHDGPLTAVRVGRAKSETGRTGLPAILVYATLPDFPATAQPYVLVCTTGSSVRVLRRDVEGLAEVIGALAAATPAQHRELAAAIRQSAALISGEVA